MEQLLLRKEDSEDEKIKKILKAPKSINTSSNKTVMLNIE